MSATQTIEALQREQDIAALKQNRAEFDRLESKILEAKAQQKFASGAERARAEQAVRDAERAFRQRNADAIATAGDVGKKARKIDAEVKDLARRLGAKLKEQRANMLSLNVVMGDVDPGEDYGKPLTDWFNGAQLLFEHCGLKGYGMEARVEPVQPTLDALDRLEARVAYVKARARLPK